MATKGSSRRTKGKQRLTLSAVVIAVVVLVVVAMNYHFILTRHGFKILKKAHWGTTDTFVDTRSWGPLDWIGHDELIDVMVNDKIDEIKKDILE